MLAKRDALKVIHTMKTATFAIVSKQEFTSALKELVIMVRSFQTLRSQPENGVKMDATKVQNISTAAINACAWKINIMLAHLRHAITDQVSPTL